MTVEIFRNKLSDTNQSIPQRELQTVARHKREISQIK